jgi:hypothetical protein
MDHCEQEATSKQRSTSAVQLAAGLDNRSFALADRRFSFASATSDAQSADDRDRNQHEFPHRKPHLIVVQKSEVESVPVFRHTKINDSIPPVPVQKKHTPQ